MIDTITGMQNMCMARTLKESEDRDPTKDPSLPVWKDYGKVNTLMKKYLLWFRNLPMHMVLIAQEKVSDNEETGEIEKYPDLSPGSRATATACVDFIGRIYSKEVRAVNKRTKKEVKKWRTLMLVGPHEVYLTKDRSGMLPRIVVEPTIPALIAAANSLEDE